MSDNLNITLRLADCKPIPMTIERNSEETIRRAEYSVNQLWQRWTLRYTDKSPHEVLAMVAFRFAELMLNQSRLNAEAMQVLAEFDSRLDRILLDVGVPDPEAFDPVDAGADDDPGRVG